MGAWIEIAQTCFYPIPFSVAPHDGCVDWNLYIRTPSAMRKCRTPRWVRGLKLTALILRTVIVCRTPRWVRGLKYLPHLIIRLLLCVAPHDGCVDWNNDYIPFIVFSNMSHPTMGAWIEITLVILFTSFTIGRTPRWVRGLKYNYICRLHQLIEVAPHDGCVDWNIIYHSFIFIRW